jgi:hypothetical protein
MSHSPSLSLSSSFSRSRATFLFFHFRGLVLNKLEWQHVDENLSEYGLGKVTHNAEIMAIHFM